MKEELLKIMAPPLKNTAFIFLKPHANTEAACTLVTEKLEEAGLSVVKDG